MTRDLTTILGVNIDMLDLQGLIQKCCAFIYNKKKSKIMYANIHTLNIAFKDKIHQNVLNNADLVYCDGEGVRWGAKLLGKYLPQRMTGADFIWNVCEKCEEKGYSIYLLGGERGVSGKAAKKLQEKFTELKIAGAHHGYFEKHGKENDAVIASINKTNSDLIFVGFGSPLQELWIHNNFNKIDSCVVWGVGAMMDFVSDKVPRGPRWMLDNGMEWLFRLIVEPRRMWKRYIVGNIIFFKRIIVEKLSGQI